MHPIARSKSRIVSGLGAIDVWRTAQLRVTLGRSTSSELRELHAPRRLCGLPLEMKRKEAPTTTKSPAKKPRPEVPDYHLTPSVKEDDGSIQWPAPRAQMGRAREIIVEWQVYTLGGNARLANLHCSAKAQKKTLIVPDKDADGLSSGAILRSTSIPFRCIVKVR